MKLQLSALKLSLEQRLATRRKQLVSRQEILWLYSSFASFRLYPPRKPAAAMTLIGRRLNKSSAAEVFYAVIFMLYVAKKGSLVYTHFCFVYLIR